MLYMLHSFPSDNTIPLINWFQATSLWSLTRISKIIFLLIRHGKYRQSNHFCNILQQLYTMIISHVHRYNKPGSNETCNNSRVKLLARTIRNKKWCGSERQQCIPTMPNADTVCLRPLRLFCDHRGRLPTSIICSSWRISFLLYSTCNGTLCKIKQNIAITYRMW